MEYLDVVDEYGQPTGARVSREQAHREGVRHRTSHVWLIRGEETKEVLLQKRSPDKDSFPGQWDISSAGHIPAGAGWRGSAIRELEEELGVRTEPEQLIDIGLFTIEWEGTFGGEPFRDRTISRVFLLYMDKPADQFEIQEEELTEVRWFELDRLIEDVKAGRMGTCLIAEELEMVRDGTRDTGCGEVLRGFVSYEQQVPSLERGRSDT